MGIIDKIRQRGKINMNAAEMQHYELDAGGGGGGGLSYVEYNLSGQQEILDIVSLGFDIMKPISFICTINSSIEGTRLFRAGLQIIGPSPTSMIYSVRFQATGFLYSVSGDFMVTVDTSYTFASYIDVDFNFVSTKLFQYK